jgi:hypothetical protein
MSTLIRTFEDHAEVIDAFGGPLKFAAAIDIPASHARAMKTRRSISPDHWPAVVAAAAAANPPIAVSLELLGQLRPFVPRRARHQHGDQR